MPPVGLNFKDLLITGKLFSIIASTAANLSSCDDCLEFTTSTKLSLVNIPSFASFKNSCALGLVLENLPGLSAGLVFNVTASLAPNAVFIKSLVFFLEVGFKAKFSPVGFP